MEARLAIKLRIEARGEVCNGERVHPEVPAVMQEAGIDLDQMKPHKLTAKLAKDAQLLITMGCGDKCPYLPGLRR
jgi:arsenate reductase